MALGDRPDIPGHRYYDWPDEDLAEIKEGLKPYRSEFAHLLNIDVRDVAARNLSDGSMVLVPELDDAVEQIAMALVRFLSALANVNDLASTPQIRRTLKILMACADITDSELDTLDPGVRRLLALSYPGGREHFVPGKVKSDDLWEAAARALAILPQNPRGRPKGSTNRAAHLLVFDLLSLFEAHSDVEASRSVIVSTSSGPDAPNSQEAGRFLQFVEVAVDALPAKARDRVTRSGGGVADLVRTVLKARKTR